MRRYSNWKVEVAVYRRAQDFGLLNERSISGIVDELKPYYVGQSGLPHCTSVDAHGNAHANCMVATTTRASLPASRRCRRHWSWMTAYLNIVHHRNNRRWRPCYVAARTARNENRLLRRPQSVRKCLLPKLSIMALRSTKRA